MKKHNSIRSHGRETRVSAAPQRFEIRKAADGSRSISGTAVVFNSKSEDLGGGLYEVIKPGAFDQSLKDNPNVLILAQHDMSQPIATVSSGTAKVWADRKGIQYTAKLPNVSWANDLAVLIQQGIVGQNSFGFSVVPGGDSYSIQPDGTVLREVNEAVLYELSIVTAPAYASLENSVSLRSAPAHIKAQIKAKRAADRKTKAVDGEALTADDFIIVGNPSDPETWHLPWRFSTEEKIKSHLRDALARFDQLKDLSNDVLKAAWKKLVGLCKEHDIEVSADDSDRSRVGNFSTRDADDPACDEDSPEYDPDACDDDDDDDDDGDDEFRCDCRCAACRSGACNRCTTPDACEDACRLQHNKPSKAFGGGGRSKKRDADDDDLEGLDQDCECDCRSCQQNRCEECSNAFCSANGCQGCPVQSRELHMALILRRLR
ncbi:MAG: HK97 family phage prohead protease [Acidobacteriaceae bacterium]